MTMMAAGAGVSAVGGLFGSLLQGQGEVNAAEANAQSSYYKAAIAMRNAAIAEQNAGYAVARGQVEAMDFGMKGRAKMGSIEAAQGASGIDMGSGTSTAVRASQAEQTRLGEDRIVDDAGLKAWNFRNEAEGQREGAALATMAGKNYQDSEGLIWGKSIVSGATGFASKWSQGAAGGLW